MGKISEDSKVQYIDNGDNVVIQISPVEGYGYAGNSLEGRYKGRIKKPIDQNEFISLYNRWQDGEIQKKFICKKLSVSMATLDRRIAEYRKK